MERRFERRVRVLPAPPPFYLARVAFRRGLGAAGQRSLWAALLVLAAALEDFYFEKSRSRDGNLNSRCTLGDYERI